VFGAIQEKKIMSKSTSDICFFMFVKKKGNLIFKINLILRILERKEKIPAKEIQWFFFSFFLEVSKAK